MNIRILLKASLYLALSSCIGHSSRTEQQQSRSEVSDEKLRRFLGEYLKQEYLSADNVRYFDALVDLNDDQQPETIIYLMGQQICGSGGCPTLVLTPGPLGYSIVSDISISRPPIRVLASISNGWRNLGVWVEGGGIQPGYEAELRYDGRRYPENPTVPPALPSLNSPGEVVIPAGAIDWKVLSP